MSEQRTALSILDAADSVEVGRRGSPCGLQGFLDSLDDKNRAQMDTVYERAAMIKVGTGRYSYIQKVITNFGGPKIDTQSISKHIRGDDGCRTS